MASGAKKKRSNIKLFVGERRVKDDFGGLLPGWLNMVKGAVEFEDLPHNISRESLQENEAFLGFKRKLVNKCLEMFADLAEIEDDYKQFYAQFRRCLMVGMRKDSIIRTKVAELLRFYSSKSHVVGVAEKLQIGFKEYVERMKDGQNNIYYVPGRAGCFAIEHDRLASPLGDVEVLYLTDPMEEAVVRLLKEFDGKKFEKQYGWDEVDEQLFGTGRR